jgi:hypothetical protein
LTGGSPIDTIQSCVKQEGEFDVRCAIIDNDKSNLEIKLALKYAAKYGVRVISNKPSLDALLLSIIDPTVDYSKKTSKWCKKTFEEKYLNSFERHKPEKYKKIMTKDRIQKYRKVNSSFNQLVFIFEAKF